MRINTPVTDTERTYSPTEQLISLTNKKGIITHANDIFVNVSGFSREELLRKNHNIVRHPGMPPEAYSDLRQTPIWPNSFSPWYISAGCDSSRHYR